MKDIKFHQVIGIMVLLFLTVIGLSDSCSVSPDDEIVMEIETIGRDATCLDLLGKWEFVGSSLRWEFRKDGWFKERQTNFFNNDSGYYSCDDLSRIVLVPDTDDYVGPYSFEVQLGKISDGQMIVFLGKKGRTEVIVKQTP